MTQYTPGPWRVECGDDPEDWPNYFPRVVTDGYSIIGTEGMYGDRDVDLANARLIAAAPTMLDALKDALCSLEISQQSDYVTSRVRAAIDAAEGRT